MSCRLLVLLSTPAIWRRCHHPPCQWLCRLFIAPNILELIITYILVIKCVYCAILYRAFKRLDKDGDNLLSFSEFQVGIQRVGVSVTPEIEKKCFELIDVDNTGHINNDEFMIALQVSTLFNPLTAGAAYIRVFIFY